METTGDQIPKFHLFFNTSPQKHDILRGKAQIKLQRNARPCSSQVFLFFFFCSSGSFIRARRVTSRSVSWIIDKNRNRTIVTGWTRFTDVWTAVLNHIGFMKWIFFFLYICGLSDPNYLPTTCNTAIMELLPKCVWQGGKWWKLINNSCILPLLV